MGFMKNFLLSAYSRLLFQLKCKTIIEEQEREITRLRNFIIVNMQPNEYLEVLGSTTRNTDVYIFNNKCRFDRVILPSTFPLNSDDVFKREQARGLLNDLKREVLGERDYFDYRPIKDVVEMSKCQSPKQSSILNSLAALHCKNIKADHPELFESLPDICNHLFSNGSYPLVNK